MRPGLKLLWTRSLACCFLVWVVDLNFKFWVGRLIIRSKWILVNFLRLDDFLFKYKYGLLYYFNLTGDHHLLYILFYDSHRLIDCCYSPFCCLFFSLRSGNSSSMTLQYLCRLRSGHFSHPSSNFLLFIRFKLDYHTLWSSQSEQNSISRLLHGSWTQKQPELAHSQPLPSSPPLTFDYPTWTRSTIPALSSLRHLSSLNKNWLALSGWILYLN